MYLIEGPKTLKGQHYGHMFMDGKTFTDKTIWATIFKKLKFKVTKVSSKKKEDIKKILIVHSEVGYGDMIFLTPAIRGLKEKYPEATIDIYGNYPSIMILAHNPLIDRVNWKFPPRYLLSLIDEYDEVYDTSEMIQKVESQLINIYELYCRHFNVTPSSMIPNIYVTEQEVASIKDQLHVLGLDFNKDKIAVLQVNASSSVRTWSLKNTGGLAKELTKKGYKVIFIGTATDIFTDYFREDFGGDGNIINLVGGLDTRAVLALISLSNIVIGPDSIGYHIAEAFGITNIPLFSSFDPYLRTKHYKNCYPVYKPYKCGPCFCHTPKCPTQLDKPEIFDVAYCMSTITVKDVMKRVDDAENKKKVVIKTPDKIMNNHCPICEGKQKGLLCRKGNVYYWKCTNCGLIYADKYVKIKYSKSYKELAKCKDPIKVLKDTKEKKISLELPDAKMIKDNTSKFLNSDFCGEYTYMFSAKSLDILCKKAGYIITNMDRHNYKLYIESRRI